MLFSAQLFSFNVKVFAPIFRAASCLAVGRPAVEASLGRGCVGGNERWCSFALVASQTRRDLNEQTNALLPGLRARNTKQDYCCILLCSHGCV